MDKVDKIIIIAFIVFMVMTRKPKAKKVAKN